MSNQYGIPPEVEQRIRHRDMPKCIYCHKIMKNFVAVGGRSDMASIEHFREDGPFYWDNGLKEEDLGICCISCNSSRSKKGLPDWFEESYCRKRNINEGTVAEPVKQFILRLNKNKFITNKLK